MFDVSELSTATLCFEQLNSSLDLYKKTIILFMYSSTLKYYET